MRLDCTETEQGLWQVIDEDTDVQIAIHSDRETAWVMAADILAAKITEAMKFLET